MTLQVSGLRPENAIYQFASTAPGTYQVMNIGRFVKRFEAFDAQGRRVPVEQVSVNQWRLSDPARVRTIRYTVAETWDSPLDHPIYMMCGTSIEADHVLHQPARRHRLSRRACRRRRCGSGWPIRRPGRWARRSSAGPTACSWRTATTSWSIRPILLGRLTRARLTVTGVPIELYAYSATDKIKASQLLSAMSGMLNAAGRFLGKLPVDRYTFLYHFADSGAGAWEHSFSSEYVLQEGEYTDSLGQRVTDIAAHEFFHIVTPLNIHSEIIEHFNFVTPVPSRHLWLYEGTTEWAAHAMQLRAGLKTPEAYLPDADPEDADRPPGVRQHLQPARAGADVVQRLRARRSTATSTCAGALTAGLLDIRLLELSNGRAGPAGPDRRAGPSLREAARVSRTRPSSTRWWR